MASSTARKSTSSGSAVLDNGLEVGARVELEGEDEDGDQIDEAWIFFSGGFGELRIGSIDDALAYSCILPPGADRQLLGLLAGPVGRQHADLQSRLRRGR